MKKLIKYSAVMALLLSFTLASCSREEENIFDESAAQRTEKARKLYTDILTADGGKWQLEYFTTDEEPGFIYLMTFDKNGSVRISCYNKFATMADDPNASEAVFKSEVSLWEVIADNGPVLSFNSYNKYFHVFASPEDVPGTSVNENGYGHEGDYEFDLMKYSNDTLYIEGKKYNMKMIMTRVDGGYDDEQYMNEVVALTDSFFNAKIPTVYVNLPGGYRHVILNGSSQILTFYPETGDLITENDQRNAIITHNGLTLGTPISLTDSIDGNKYSIQHFIRQSDGSLLCTDDNKTTITADKYHKVFTDQNLSWQINTVNSAGESKALYDALATAMKDKKYTVNSIKFLNPKLKDDPDKYALSITLKRTGSTNTLTLQLYYYVTLVDGEKVTLNFDGTGDKNAVTLRNSTPALQAFVDDLDGKTFSCIGSSRLAPIVMKLSESDTNYFSLDVQR